MSKYKAFFNGRETTVQADGLYPAKLAAVAFFKPSKSKAHMVHVVLIENDKGEAVGLFDSNADFG